MTAPVCPINTSQSQRVFQPVIPPQPGIPAATDLASLIRTVNAIRDILRSLTTSLTVNNVYNPQSLRLQAQGNTFLPEFPEWDFRTLDTSQGYVYHHKNKTEVDKKQRAHIMRVNSVTYQNRMREEPDFVWSYYRPLDSLGVEPLFPTASPLGG